MPYAKAVVLHGFLYCVQQLFVIRRITAEIYDRVIRCQGFNFANCGSIPISPIGKEQKVNGGPMHTLTRLGTSAAAMSLVTLPAMTSAIYTAAASPGADDGTRVALDADLRECDFSLVRTSPMVPRALLGSGSAVIHTAGSRVVAQVHLVDGAEPGTHFNVGLIQEPRPSSGGCGPGDPGTAFSGFDTDAAGTATVTLQDSIRPGTTGVWVMIERADGHSQNPSAYYSSEFVAPV